MSTESKSQITFENKIIFLISIVQFINILDFMMVMPLGPDFAKSLMIPNSELGMIGGSYTGAAALSGLVGALFLDYFDRKKALLFMLMGLSIATILGGFCTSFVSLLTSRVLAGSFGGPASSIALAIISDVIPGERRGKALGIVMSSFSLASIFGVPIGLELARLGGWHIPFFVIGSLGIVAFLIAYKWLPTMTKHLNSNNLPKASDLNNLLKRKEVRMSLMTMSLIMVGSFILIPNLSSYIQFNAGYPREKLGLLYFVSGCLSFVAVRKAGQYVDRFGTTVVTAIVTLCLCLNILFGMYSGVPHIPVMLIMIFFMLPNSIRNVACNTLITKIPQLQERARFQSLQSSAQHMSCAVGSFIGALLLTSDPLTGKLYGLGRLSIASILLAIIVIPMIYAIEKKVRLKAN